MVSGLTASASTNRDTICGGSPCSFNSSCATLTLMAAGSTAPECALTTTGLPVTTEANRPGSVFQVGKVEQPITSAAPRPQTVNFFSITSGSCLPCGLVQVACAGTLAMAS